MAQPVKPKIKSSSSSRTSQAQRAGCMQIICKIFSISLLCLVAFCIIRAYILYPYPKLPEPCDQQSDHQAITIETGIVDRFRSALTYKTISWSAGNYNRDELVRFREFIQKSFPTLHSSALVKREIIANYSLLYEIEGADKSLKPYMLCAHMDVVPVERDKWNFDPFGGNVDGGFIYGRGAVDVKDALMGILEAIEFELRRGFKPKRTIYLAFGHDEEVMGKDGAVAIRDYLMAKGVQLEFILDEGTVILKEAIIGVPVEKLAVIGVAEKGYLTVKLEVQGEAGHASAVPYESTIVILSKALSKFNSHAHLDMFGTGPERSFFESLAPYANPAFKVILGNLWLFGWLYSRIVSLYPVGNAMVRTTSVVTVINGGLKDNMIPTFASALINHRIHPSQTINDIVEYDKKIINDDRVNVSIVYGNEPASSSPHGDDNFGYQTIKQSIQQIFPETVVVPGIMIAGTDTKWYKPLTECIFRFSPLVIFKEEMILFHGHNERISIDNYVKAVNFYHHVILSADRSELPKPAVKDEL